MNDTTNAGWVERIAVPELQKRVFSQIRGKKHSYGELAEDIRRLLTLFEEQGLAEGDCIVLSVRDEYQAALFFLAFLRYGVTSVLIDPDVPAERARALITKADAQGFVMDDNLFAERGIEKTPQRFIIPVVAATQKKGALFRKLVKGAVESPAATSSFPAVLKSTMPASTWPKMPSPQTLAYVVFTSGTSAEPKGVMITHQNLHSHLRTLSDVYEMQDGDRLLNILLLYHADGLIQGPVLAAFNAGTWVNPLRFDISKIADLFAAVYKYRITHFISVPTILSLLNRLSDGYEDSFQTEDFRVVVSAASQLSEHLWSEFESKFGVRIANGYGLTETVAGALFSGLGDSTRRIGTVGKPVDCAARIVGPDGAVAKVGEKGQLLLRGDNVSPGYLKDEAATAEAIRDGWLHTGDEATQDADGFVRIVGRMKNVVNSGGFNIYPEQVTEVIDTHPDIMQSVSLGLPDAVFGEKLVSAVVTSPGSHLTQKELIAFLRDRLETNQVPETICFLDDLPRGISGKVRLGAVRELLSKLSDSEAEYVQDLRSILIATAAEAFKVPQEQLSMRDNSNTVEGWDSMAHLDFITTLEERFDTRFTTAEVITMNTLSNAERVLNDRRASNEL